jgi:hypothetical protein
MIKGEYEKLSEEIQDQNGSTSKRLGKEEIIEECKKGMSVK